jgi:putative transcriptional regulator
MEKRRLHRINEILKKKGRSQYWLAQETGITANSINGYVKDRVEPSLTNLFRIAHALGVKVKDLINE